MWLPKLAHGWCIANCHYCQTSNLISLILNSQMFHDRLFSKKKKKKVSWSVLVNSVCLFFFLLFGNTASQFCLLKQRDISREFLFQANNSRRVYYPLFFYAMRTCRLTHPPPKKRKERNIEHAFLKINGRIIEYNKNK